MNLYVKIMSRDKCLEIAKIVRPDDGLTWQEELLNWLPHDVFGKTHRVSFVNHGCFEIYVKEGSTDTWSVPTYFVEHTNLGGPPLEF